MEIFIEQMEATIDVLLRDSFDEDTHLYSWNLRDKWGELVVPQGSIREDIIKKLEPRYKEAGWDLSYDNKSGILIITEG
jgi:hypothetical protein